jgi:murein DD-endopeptidase MepM/ murein hydrolase activator NlpD
MKKIALLFFFIVNAFSLNVSALELDGVWQQGAVIVGRVAKDVRVEFADRELLVAENGQFVIGLGRDAERQARLTTITADGVRKEHIFEVSPREYNIQRVTGVPQRTVEPSAEQVERSRREAQLVTKARNVQLDTTDFAKKFRWPLTGRISGVYGSQRFYNGKPGSPHYGVDIAAPVGTEVSAPAGGVVTLVHPDMFFSGGTLIVDHGHGLSSTFIHLHKILVKEGDRVEQGQKIAQVGATGRATGPHLDWRMNWFDQRVDPQLLVGDMSDSAQKK